MSEFSGKCDVWDTLFWIGNIREDYDWSKLKMYQGDTLLEIKSLKDLIKYAPYLISSYGFCNGEYTCYITREPFIDRQEREHMEWRLKDAQRLYRKLKRKKQEFIPEEAEKLIWGSNSDIKLEICKRVKEHPTKANVDGIHDDVHNYYREEWFNAMLKYGYTEEEAKQWIY